MARRMRLIWKIKENNRRGISNHDSYFWDSWDLTPMLEPRSHQLPTLYFHLYSKSHLLFLPKTAFLCFYLMYALLYYVLHHTSITPSHFPHFWYPWLMLCSLTLYIKLSILYDNDHVWILTLILISLLLDLMLILEPLILSFQTSRNNPLSLPEL